MRLRDLLMPKVLRPRRRRLRLRDLLMPKVLRPRRRRLRKRKSSRRTPRDPLSPFRDHAASVH